MAIKIDQNITNYDVVSEEEHNQQNRSLHDRHLKPSLT